MQKVEPFIRCTDYWPMKIPPECMNAYGVMVRDGQIRNQRVVFNEKTKATIIEYDSTHPHEWVLEELKEIAGR